MKRFFTDYIKNFLEEFTEIFIAICLYKYLLGERRIIIVLIDALKIGVIMGAIITIIEEYNYDYKSNLKSGMFSSMGSSLIKFTSA